MSERAYLFPLVPGAEPGVHDGARHVDGKDDGGDDERDGELLVLGHFLVLLARPLLDLLLGSKGKGGMSEGAMGREESGMHRWRTSRMV